MKRLKSWSIHLLMFSLILAGCTLHQKMLPLNDDVLVYNLPYDLTYLRTLEALQNVDGWELEETEKEKGVIVVRNISFSAFDDADKRIVKVLVLRENRYQSSIQLAPDSQRVLGGEMLLKTISQYLSREL